MYQNKLLLFTKKGEKMLIKCRRRKGLFRRKKGYILMYLFDFFIHLSPTYGAVVEMQM